MPTLIQRTLGPAVQKMSGTAWFAKNAPRFVPKMDRFLHKVSGGRVLLGQLLVPHLVLTTTGAVSGLQRETPLACLPEADGSWIVVGSNFGREKHPAWTGNLLKEPKAQVSFGGKVTPVAARLVSDEAERTELWPRLMQNWPNYDIYAERSGRELRIFRLVPVGG